MVDQGERGDQGQRGVAGERGPKGDHGQPGDTGKQGVRGRSNPLAIIGYLILTLCVFAAFVSVWHSDRKVEAARFERIGQINRVNAAQCASLRNLYGVIRKTLKDGDMALDKIDYYRVHPREREEAHNRNQDTLRLFRDPPCPSDVTIP